MPATAGWSYTFGVDGAALATAADSFAAVEERIEKQKR